MAGKIKPLDRKKYGYGSVKDRTAEQKKNISRRIKGIRKLLMREKK